MSDFLKNDKGKLQWSLMPFEQLEDVVRVLMAGATKYGRENWKKCDDISRYKDALMRHVTAYIKGEERDPEDNLPHLAHAICNCLFLQYFDSKIVITNTKKWIPDKEAKDTAMFGMNGVLVDAEAVKENEEASLWSVPDKNGEFVRIGTQVKVFPKGEENFHLGVVLWDKKGFYINTFKKDYRLDEVVWFEIVKTVAEQMEDKNEQEAIHCSGKEDNQE